MPQGFVGAWQSETTLKLDTAAHIEGTQSTTNMP